MTIQNPFSVAAVSDFYQAKKKGLLALIIGIAIFLPLLHIVSQHWAFGHSFQENGCLPFDYFWVEKGVVPTRGEVVVFRPQRGIIPLFTREDGLWTKYLVGAEGDRIDVVKVSTDQWAKAPERYTEAVYADGVWVNIKIQGYVYLQHNQDTIVFRCLEKSVAGQKLPMIQSQTIPPGKYFVYGTTPRSYDSRYWGLIDKSWIYGKAHPII